MSDLEAQIDALNSHYIESLSRFARGDFIREGVLKEALTGLIWGVYEAMPDQRYGLADAMDNWPDLIRDAMSEDDPKGAK